MATDLASWPDQLRVIDDCLRQLIEQMAEQALSLKSAVAAGDEGLRLQHEAFLIANCAVFNAYRLEIEARDLALSQLPQMYGSMGRALGIVEEVRKGLLQ
ncbi:MULTISPECIES: hypothetical protein [unclassified Bradyrhizobium]|uniref:hypothetical protein n=1 Tax=unclassified Bradyrhizobium TaxID=2631580 RepID=UPI00291671AD|nr:MULTISPECIES: hypothetical protein [unclassified Bradyrhizobium]